jgi:hypothetical protein
MYLCRIRGFSVKTANVLLILKSGLFRGIFQFGLKTLWETKNPPEGNGPRLFTAKANFF